MEVGMKGIKVTEWEMEKVNFTISKVVFMMENGKIIICMGMENYTILTINWLMKENGLLISFMAGVEFLMINLRKSMDFSTIQTLII